MLRPSFSLTCSPSQESCWGWRLASWSRWMVPPATCLSLFIIAAFIGVELTLLVLLLGSVIGSLFGMFLIFGVWLKRLARRRRRLPSEPAKIARARAWQSARLIPRYFPIPFGVFLGIGALVAAFWGHALIDWYKNISGLNRIHMTLVNL